ncbi:MAG: hypothetical protein LC808_16215 [Actinobacteria bacterium]|nr:hypothetical protein [Actinomycetota bacterium]
MDRAEMAARSTERLARSVGIALSEGTRTWFPIQALLTAAANISKTLWGQNEQLAAQREPLRTALNVTDTSPLRTRLVRNRFDHYDETVDEWWRSSQGHNHVDLSFGDWGSSSVQGIAPQEIFRTFDPSTGDVVFWGQRYNIPEVVAEVERIMPIALIESVRFEVPPTQEGEEAANHSRPQQDVAIQNHNAPSD